MKLLLPLLLCCCCSFGTSFLQAQNVAGPLTGTAYNSAALGTFSWTGVPGATATADGVYTTASSLVGLIFPVTSNYMVIQNLGFNLLSTDIIDGIKVEVKRVASGLAIGGSVTDNSVMLTTGGLLVGTDQASASAWPIINAFATYGGASSTWGAGLLPADVNASTFGVAISINLNPGIVSLTEAGNVDQVKITVYSHPGIILPVHLADFSSLLSGPSNLLSWSAYSLESADQFVVERSADGTGWQDLASVPAFVNTEKYTYSDLSPLDGDNYYRVRMTGPDGHPVYSTISKINRDANIQVRVFPNPVVNSVSIESQTPIHKVVLQDLGGRILSRSEPGSNGQGKVYNLNVPMNHLPKGIYVLQVDGKNFKLLKQ